jgi:hypothetical protein
MNLFRSEEHIERWLGDREPGATISVRKLSELAQAWWDDRLSPEWRPHTREQNQAIFVGLGLVLLAAGLESPLKCQVLRPRKATGLDGETLSHLASRVKGDRSRTSRNLRESTCIAGCFALERGVCIAG